MTLVGPLYVTDEALPLTFANILSCALINIWRQWLCFIFKHGSDFCCVSGVSVEVQLEGQVKREQEPESWHLSHWGPNCAMKN